MRYKKIEKDFFIKNRKKFANNMEECSMAIFNSNHVYPLNADSMTVFKQNSDIFYLTGVDEPSAILIICPHAHDQELKEVLFIKKTNAHIAMWEGEILDKEKARELTGISAIHWLDDFDFIFNKIAFQCDKAYLNVNEHLRAIRNEIKTKDDFFNQWFKNKYPSHQVRRSAPILHRIRSVKSKYEIDIMKNACEITNKGYLRVMNFVKPNVMEYDVEAEFIHEFTINGSKGFAYTPIIGAGKNNCIFHYVDNSKKCLDGDLLLLDVGAEYSNYCCDVTRVLPISGRFNDRQKEVYNAVLNVKKAAAKKLIPGVFLDDYHREVGLVMEEELVKLGLISVKDIKNQDDKNPLYKRYFPHGTSHFLGLDTHDVGLWNEPIKANMVFTVEPGIYLPKEGFGIRLEDDYLVKQKGDPINLTEDIPIEIDDIEEVMKGK